MRRREGSFDVEQDHSGIRLEVAHVPEELGRFDAAMIVTDHDEVDYPGLCEVARLIVDTRGVFLEPAPNVVKA